MIRPVQEWLEMLTDILSFNERKSSGVSGAPDHKALRKTLDLLHKDDQAVLRNFGISRQGLLAEVDRLECSRDVKKLPGVEALGQKINVIVSLAVDGDVGECEIFWEYYTRWFGYFKHVFENDERYGFAAQWVDMETFIPGVRAHLTSQIKMFSEKSLVHQLNSHIADGADLDVETFSRKLVDETLASFLTSYPVLTRLVVERIEDTVAYLYKVVAHFAEDIDQLEAAFALAGRRIDSITLGLGDAHANGETVCCIQIGDHPLVYKPRSNREALFYGALLEQLHESTGYAGFSIYAPVMVSSGDHSWIEKIENVACETENDLALFYQRLGAQVAVVHALNGIDFHFENIIACGSNPVLIDLECLFTSSIIDLKIDLPQSRALFKTIKFNSQSVFSTGFLPTSAESDDDYSGLCRQPCFAVKQKQLVREQRFYRLKQADADHQPMVRHLPVFEGQARSVAEYKEAFFLGFELAYDEVMNRRHAVLELLAEHAGALKTRVLIKNTKRYGDFIGMMFHPRFTKCRFHQELLLATLWSDLSGTLGEYDIPRHEIKDLEKANVPCFTMPLLSSQLIDAHGQPVASLAIESPFESCRRKLDSLSLKDKVFQLHIVQMCVFPVANETLALNRRHQLKTVTQLSHAHYLEGATSIAGAIEAMRIEGEEGDVGWTFMDTHPRTLRHFISPMNNGLYNGVGGLAIFYLSLFRVCGATRYLNEAERILCAMSKSQGQFTQESTVSAYNGLTSYLYVLVNYQLMTGRQTYLTTIEELLHKLAEFPREGDQFDFIHGRCGTVTVLVNLYQLERRETLLPLIERYSQAIQSAVTLENGALLFEATSKPLWTGFSHGISGALLAIGKVWEVTKEPRLAELIVQWLHAENRLADDEFWLDLRKSPATRSMSKWCHGDAGILITRRWLAQAMGETLDVKTRTVLQQDAERCERHLWELGLGAGYSLCHGDFGNLLCLLKHYRETSNEPGIAKVKQAISQVAHNFFNENFLEERNVPELGMMLGITGVGLSLLSVIDGGLPDVLSMEFARPTNAA